MMSVQQFFSAMRTRQLLVVAGETLLIYDHILTFHLEVDYIWNAPWSLVKGVFLFNRYGNLIGQTLYTLEELGILSQGSDKFCFHFQWFVAIYGILSQESIHILVLLRAWAIWGCKHNLAIIMITTYGLYLTVSIVLVVVQFILVNPKLLIFLYLAETGVCFLPGTTTLFHWVLPLMSGSLDTVVSITVAYSLTKLLRGAHSFQPSLVFRVLAKDAALYFFVDITVVAIGIVCQTLYSLDPRNMIMMAFVPFITVAGQRVVLNLRRLQPRRDTVQTRDRNLETGPAVDWRSAERHSTDSLHSEVEPRQDVEDESAIELFTVKDLTFDSQGVQGGNEGATIQTPFRRCIRA